MSLENCRRNSTALFSILVYRDDEPKSRVLLEKLIFTQLANKLHAESIGLIP
jgi:hypothetical protein